MKKNLLTIVILALLIVNLVLTGIIMFSSVAANKKTIALVNDIAAVLDLELSDPTGELPEFSSVPITDSVPYSFDTMTIALKQGADGKDHYCMCDFVLSMNKSDPDYDTYSAMMGDQQNKIKSIITSVVGEYTNEDVRLSSKAIEEEILKQVQTLFGSRFIYEAYFVDMKVQ